VADGCLGFGLWLCVGVGVGVTVRDGVGVGVGVAVCVGVVLGVGVTVPVAAALAVAAVLAVAVVRAVSLAEADMPAAEADAVAFDCAAEAAPPAHGSSTKPADIEATPASASIRPTQDNRAGRMLMVFLVRGIERSGWSWARRLSAQLAGLTLG